MSQSDTKPRVVIRQIQIATCAGGLGYCVESWHAYYNSYLLKTLQRYYDNVKVTKQSYTDIICGIIVSVRVELLDYGA